ncbi:hypothetical protein [Roseivirga misakiensis]|uniref:Outer membrane lipoprotein-sorting protein n=1 Tax=Roseivirga misakiensis TaxID=1563681 RepID=A0A1E5T346_9BACT|nr:hypothetical protein [Roseivirga misakiensis]OEK05800.1 hypothetical protein BFP71_06685 [Roseivirga misakiensis]
MMTRKLTLFIAMLAASAVLKAQTIADILSQTNQALGTEVLEEKKTIQFDLIQKHQDGSQSVRVTAKGNNKIRADIQQESGQLSLIRNGSSYMMEVGFNTKEITSTQTKKNLNRQHLIKGLLKILDLDEGATFEERTTEAGRNLVRIKSEEGNKKSILWIDSETWLPVRHREVVTRNNGKKKVTVTNFKGYETVDGVTLPMRQNIKVTMPNGNEFDETYILSNVELGIRVSNSFFTSRQ